MFRLAAKTKGKLFTILGFTRGFVTDRTELFCTGKRSFFAHFFVFASDLHCDFFSLNLLLTGRTRGAS